jgi:hypothetical protein
MDGGREGDLDTQDSEWSIIAFGFDAIIRISPGHIFICLN